MLVDISIADLGVIESSSAELSHGLTVLTGETGAGKTMVVTGLRLLAGGRADASRVRDGAAKAAVEGHFSSHSEAVAQLVEDAGGEADENGEYIASRTVSSAGRSRAYLGGRAVPAATLGDFASHLITVHGQNDQLRLLAADQQLAAIDRFEPAISKVRTAYTEAFSHWRALAKDFQRRTESRREMAQEVDRLQFAITEITDLDPEPGEDAELVTLIRRLQDVDSLREAAASALTALDGGEGFGDEDTAVNLVGAAESALAGSTDAELARLGERLSEVSSQLTDIATELATYLSDLPADPSLLEESLQRQQELKRLTRKYAADIDGVLEWRDSAEAKLATLDTSSEALEALKKDVMEAEKVVVAKAEKLTSARTKAAKKLGSHVTEEIHGLAMPNSTLTVTVNKTKYSKSGADEVEFQLNGKPLASAASGGELSRVMLAMEVVLASGDGTTLVFDEVDAGVGGRAAVEIGRRLARLSTTHQVICVTHLPQVAAYADSHLHVSKEKFTSGVADLSAEERVEELARMLAGLDDTDTGRAHAQELFDRAQAEVAAFRAPSTH
ncbi:DNA repair protein RecN [Corynebacterium singulare]|uniref:DNA repair protein RecN n=1 Tax=Corynebacterium singulare TaxID=161899 RepID=A0A0B6F4N4_9CORY|nr:DNA repair protein RecN [Corynebacterium singulare]AJI78991.1 DNA replication and repair protein RecN [Corynebacterium singulare]